MPQDPFKEILSNLEKQQGFDYSKRASLATAAPQLETLLESRNALSFGGDVAKDLQTIRLAKEAAARQPQELANGVSELVRLDSAIKANPTEVEKASDPSWYDLPGVVKNWASFWGQSDALIDKSIAQANLTSEKITDEDMVISSVLRSKVEEGDLGALKELKEKFQNIVNSPIGESAKEQIKKNYQTVEQHVTNLNRLKLAQQNLDKYFQGTDAATRQKQLDQGINPIKLGVDPNQEKSNLNALAELENNRYGSALYNDNDLEVFKQKDLQDMRTGTQGRYNKLLSNMELSYNAAMTAAVQDKLNTLDDQIAEQSKKMKENSDPTLRAQYAKELNTLTSQKNEYQKFFDKVSPTAKESVYLKKYYPEVYEENQKNKKQELYRNSGEQGWWGRAGEAGIRTFQNFASNVFKQGSGMYSLVGADTWAFETGLYADNLRPPSYYMGKDLNKNGQIDNEEIQRDIHGNQITWDQVHYTDSKGEGHWNLWSATEQVLPIAADIGLTIFASKGAGAAARGAGFTWEKIGASVGLEGAKLTTFTKSVAPRLATFGSVTATTFPRFYAEERRNFKNDSDAFGVALSRAVVEGLSETITPDVLMFQKGARAGYLDDLIQRGAAKLPVDLNRFATKIDLLLGLAPKNGLSRTTAAMLLAPTVLKNTIGQATQESIEEIGSLIGNHFVDKYARSLNLEASQDNEISLDSMAETFVSGFIPSLFISGVSGNIGVQKYRTGTARWDIANNPETYTALIARQVESGKLSKEEGIKKTAQIKALSNKFEQMMPEMSNIRNLNTLLDDKEAQFNHFVNVNHLEDLLDVDVTQLTEEQRTEYEKELESSKNAIIKTREIADKYANLSEVEKQEIIKKNFDSKIKALEDPETTLGSILQLAQTMNPETLDKTKNDERFEFMNQNYEAYNAALTQTLLDRVSTFEDILLNSPEELTLLELQVMRDRFLPVLEKLQKENSPFLGTLPMAPLMEQQEQQTAETLGPQLPRITQLLDAEIATRRPSTEEETVLQIAANLNNPEVRSEQRMNMAVAGLTDAQLENGLSEKEAELIEKTYGKATLFQVAQLIERHQSLKELGNTGQTPLEMLRNGALNNDYSLATLNLTPEEASKKINDINTKALENSKQGTPRQNFGGKKGINPINPIQDLDEDTVLFNYNKDVFEFFAGVTQELIELEQSNLDVSEKQQEKARILKEAIGTLSTLQDRLSFASGLLALFPQLGNKVDALVSEENITQDFFTGIFPTAPTLSRALFTAYSTVLNTELNKSNTTGELTVEFTQTPTEDSPLLKATINTPEGVGHISAKVLPDGTAYITDIQIGYDENAPRNKGYGLAAYIELGNKLAELGYTLESTQWDKHTSGISPQAIRVWEKLVEQGYAEVIGNKENKVYNRETGEEDVLFTDVYSFKTNILKQGLDEPTFSDKSTKDQKFEDKVIDQQLDEELSRVDVAPDNMALKIVTAKKGDVSTLSDPVMIFAYNIVQEISKSFRKGNDPELSVRAQSMMGIYEFILSEEDVATLKEYKSKQKLTEEEANNLRNILSMDGRSLHNEGFISYIISKPSSIGTGVGTIVVDSSGAPVRFNSKGKPLKTKGSYFISVLPKDQTSKRATDSILKLRNELENTNTVAVSPITGTVSGADVIQPLSNRPGNKLYLHTSEKAETQKTEFAEYTLLTGGLYIQNDNPVVPYSKVLLPKASGLDVLMMLEAFNTNTLPTGLDADLYTNPTAFLNYLEGLIYFSEKKTGLRLGVNTKGKVVFYKKGYGNKYRQITGSAQTQLNTVSEALKNTFYSVNKDLLESNRPFTFLKLEDGKLKAYSFNSYDEYVRSKEFGAQFSAKENETISFGGTIEYTNLADSVAPAIEPEVVPVNNQGVTSQDEQAALRDEYNELKEAYDKGELGPPVDRAIAKYPNELTFYSNIPNVELFDSSIRRNYINDFLGRDINEVAEYISKQSGVNVTPMDLINFMVSYPNGVGTITSTEEGTFYGTYNPDGSERFQEFVNKPEEKTSLRALVRKSGRIGGETNDINPDELLRSIELDNKISEEQDKKAKAWIDSHPIFSRTKLIFDRTTAHPLAYATWSKAAIFLFEGANYADAYHEAWHEFSQMYLSPEEREALYNQARKIYGNLSDLEIEEKLAEDFRAFALSDGKVFPDSIKKHNESKNIFTKMWEFLKSFFTDKPTIDSYFTNLYKGNLSSYSYKGDAKFKTLYSSKFKGVTPESTPFEFTFKESAKLTDQLDSLFVNIVKEVYEPQGITIINVLNNKKAVQAVYSKMGGMIDALLDSYSEMPTSSITPTKQRKFDYLDMLANNYQAVVAHHLKNSTLFDSNKVKNALLEEEVEFAKGTLSEFANFEASINEKSGKTNAAPLIIAAIKTLPEYSEKRRKRKDTVFGTDYLGNFDQNWDILQKTLANSGNYEELYSRLKELSTKYLQFKPLLSYLPNPKDAVTRQSTLNFKNLFINTFAQPYIDGYTSKIQYEMTEDGELEISDLKIFEASNLDAVNLRRVYDQRFSSTLGPYKVINPETGSSALNIAKYLTDFPEVPGMKAVMTPEEAEAYNRSLYEFLVPLGFDLSEAGLNLLVKSDSKTLRQNVERIHSKISSLAELQEFRNQNKDAQYYISSPLTEISADHKTPQDKKVSGETTSIMEVIKFETDANVEYVGDMRYNALGDKIWSVNPHNYMSRVVSGLNNAQVYPTLESLFKDFPQLDYRVNPAVAYSPLINYLFKSNGQRHVDKLGNPKTIELANLLGIEDIKPSKTVDAISAKKHFADIKGLLTKGVEELNRLSGKSTTRSLVLPYELLKNDFEMDKPFVNQEKSEVPGTFISNVITKLLAGEILVHNNPSSRFRGTTLDKDGIPRFGFFEDILGQGLRANIHEATKGLALDKIKETLTSNPDIYPKIVEAFRKYIASNVEESQNRLKGNYPVTIDELTKYHAYSFVARIDQHKLFFGHPYYYKNSKEVEKRISAWNAFGSNAITDNQNLAFLTPTGYNQRKAYLDYNQSLETPRTVVANEQDASKINYLVLKDNPVNSITAYLSEAYGNLKEAYTNNGKKQDAAAFCTMDFFKRFYAMSTGISEDMQKEFERQDKIYSLYLQQKAGENVTEELNKKLNEGPYYKFTIKKLQYAGQNLFDNEVVPVFHKYSVKPILPSELVSSEGLASIVEKLHLSGADYAVFESGTKIAETTKPIDLFNEDGSINSNGSVTGKIDMLGLKEQVLIENKENFKTIFSTQFRKLLYKDMTPAAQSLYNAYVGYIDEIVNYDKSSFLSNVEDQEKLVEFLLGELSKKNASEATKDLIKLKENGQLQYVLDSFLDRTIMESTMASSIKSSIIKQKVPGVQRVQYPVSLVRPETTLRYYDIDNGRIRQAETMISFSSAYYPLLKLVYKGKQIAEFVDGKPVNRFTALQTLNEALKDKKFLKDNAKFLDQALTTVAIRVPGQGYNSMESFRVVEFLPEESGEIILVPDEMVVKSGSDYDIDKLFCYDPYISDDLTVPTTKKKGSVIFKERAKAEKDLENALAIRKELAKDKSELIKQVKAIIDKHGYNSENIKLRELRDRLIDLEDNNEEDIKSALERLANRNDWSTKESKQQADPIKKEIEQLRSLLSEAREKDLTQSIANVVESLARIEQDIQKYNSIIKNGRAALTNNLFLNIKERLSNVEIFESLITPNSSDLIKEEAAKYDRDKFKTASYTNIVNPLYQLYVHELNSFKRSLGVDAKNNTFHALAQKAGLKIVDEYAVTTYPLPFNGMENDVIDLSRMTDVEGNLISELSGQMITAHVDIEKEDDIAIINFNNLITPTANYMNMAGSTFQDIVKLINTSYVYKGKTYTSSIIGYSQGESAYDLMMAAVEKVKELTGLDYTNEPALKYIYASEEIKYKKLFAKLLQSEIYLDGTYLERKDAYGDLLRLAGFLAAKEQQDEVFKISSNVDFDTFSPQNLESFFMWRNELKKFYQMEKPYFNLDAITFLATKTEVAGFAITQEFMDKLKPLFPITLDTNVLSTINSIANDKAFSDDYEVLSKAFKNEYIYAIYRNAVPEVAEFEKLLDKKNLGNIFNLYNDLKLRLKNKGIESENEIFDNATFNTEANVAWYRTGLRIPEADYTTDVLREEFEQGFSWTNSKLNPAKAEDAKLIEDMRAFFKAFAYAGIIGTQLNKRYDSYLPMIPEEVFTYKVNDLLKEPSRYISMDQFKERFISQHPEFFGLRSTANPELKYFKDFDLSRNSLVETLKAEELTTTTQSYNLTEPQVKPVVREKLYDKTDTELKFGSVVEYTPAKATAPMKFLYWGNNSKGQPRLINIDGSKFPGNPNPRALKVLGSYPIVQYNNVGYIVTDNGNIYSTATGDLVYQGEDNSSKVQKERILAEANKLLTPAPTTVEPTIDESIEARRNEIVRSTFQDLVNLNNELRKNC